MKKRFLYSIVFLLLCTNVQAQLFIKEKNVNEIKGMNFLVVSFKEWKGQSLGWNSYHIHLAAGESGVFTDSVTRREVELNTLTEILNYVTTRGWDFVQLSPIGVLPDMESSNKSYLEYKIIFKRTNG